MCNARARHARAPEGNGEQPRKAGSRTHRDPGVGTTDPKIFGSLLMSEVAEVVRFLGLHLCGPFSAAMKELVKN